MHLHKEVEENKIREVFSQFEGKIIQKPPVRSHVKRVERERTVYKLEILEIKGREVLFKADVQSGTYIRKLISDIGEKLGVGAHMQELRRTRVANITEDKNLVTLEEIEDAIYFYLEKHNGKFLNYLLMNPEDIITFLPRVWIKDSAVNSICLGAKLAFGGIAKTNKFEKDSWVMITSLKDEFVALGKALVSFDEMMQLRKGFVIKTDRVFMLPNTYPRYK